MSKSRAVKLLHVYPEIQKHKQEKKNRMNALRFSTEYVFRVHANWMWNQTNNITCFFAFSIRLFFQLPLVNYFNNQKLLGWHFVPICFGYHFPVAVLSFSFPSDFSISSHFNIRVPMSCTSRTGPFTFFCCCRVHMQPVYRYCDCENHALRVQLLFFPSFFFALFWDPITGQMSSSSTFDMKKKLVHF